METLQILGWIYLGLTLGSIGGVIMLGLFQAGRVESLERLISDLEFKNRILRGDDEFQEVPWDEAIDIAAEEISRV